MKIVTGLPPVEIDLGEHMNRPSTRLWMAMLYAGKWDRRRLKRVFRLIDEGR